MYKFTFAKKRTFCLSYRFAQHKKSFTDLTVRVRRNSDNWKKRKVSKIQIKEKTCAKVKTCKIFNLFKSLLSYLCNLPILVIIDCQLVKHCKSKRYITSKGVLKYVMGRSLFLLTAQWVFLKINFGNPKLVNDIR